MFFFFMEGPHRFGSICIYFNWTIIDFRECLQFDVISPNSILPLFLNILFKILFPSYNELREKFFFVFNVIHAKLAYKIKVHLVPVVNLIGNSPKHAVSIAFNVSDLHAFFSKLPSECVFLLFYFLNSLNHNLLFFFTHVSYLLF